MSKNRPPRVFVPPWPVAVHFLTDSQDQLSGLLGAYSEARRRTMAYLASTKSRQIQARYRRSLVAWMGTGEDLLYAEADTMVAKAVANVLSKEAGKGCDAKSLVLDFLHWLGGYTYHLERSHFDVDCAKDVLLDVAREDEAACSTCCRNALAALSRDPTLLAYATYPDILRRFAVETAPTFEDRELLLLALPLSDDLPLQALSADDTEGEVARLRDEAHERRVRLREVYQPISADFDQISRRISWTETFLLESLSTALAHLDDATTDPQLVSLLSFSLRDLKLQISGLVSPATLRMSAEDKQRVRALAIPFAASEFFWYTVLSQELSRSGAIQKDRLAAWVRPLLVDLLNRPAQLMRRPVCREGEKTRTVLARRFSPFFRKSRPQSLVAAGRLFTAEAIAEVEDAHLLRMVAEELTTCVLSQDAEKLQLPDNCVDIVCEAWETWCHPFVHENLLLAARCARISDPAVSIFDLYKPVETELVQTINQTVEEEAPGATVPSESSAPPVLNTWLMLRDPAQSLSHAVAIAWNDASIAEKASWIDAQDWKVGIPGESLLNALQYYTSLSPVTRSMLPHETIGGHRWRKMKRGKARILVREEDGNLIFHAFPRKNWISKGRIR